VIHSGEPDETDTSPRFLELWSHFESDRQYFSVYRVTYVLSCGPHMTTYEHAVQVRAYFGSEVLYSEQHKSLRHNATS
jgi:hypothetical protein